MSKDSTDSDELFSNGFDNKDEKIEENPDVNSEFPPIPNTDPDDDSDKSWEIPDKPPEKPKKSSRKKMILIAVGIGLLVGGFAFVVENIGDDFNINPIELGKSIDPPEEKPVVIEDVEKPVVIEDVEKPPEPFKDVSSASDKVELEKTNDVIGYYLVTTDDDWYGDFVDFRKIPSKIEKTGSQKINFRCYSDDFAGTSTYFGTFRNVIENSLTVEVYIKDLEVETKSTNSNKALILEGNCLQ